MELATTQYRIGKCSQDFLASLASRCRIGRTRDIAFYIASQRASEGAVRSLLAQPLQSSAGSRMVGHGHEAEVVFVGCLCIAVLLFFLAVGIWQQRVWLPRRAKELLGELRKDRMEKRV